MARIRQILSAALWAGLFTALAAQASDCRINWALAANGAVASQKDDPFGMPASKGNDGKIAADMDFAHTGNADNEWWEVNLGAVGSLATVPLGAVNKFYRLRK